MLTFDEAFYLERYPGVAEAVARGEFESGEEHFILFGQAEGRLAVRPNLTIINFDEAFYLERYPGVAEAVARGEFRSGEEHFILFGQAEGRLPSANSTDGSIPTNPEPIDPGIPNGPTPQEQEMLELTNRMRMNPAAELDILVDRLIPISSADPDVDLAVNFFEVDGNLLASQWNELTPAQPLAWSEVLHDAASSHNQDMIALDIQAHEIPGGPSLRERIENVGYNGGAGENIFAFASSVFQGHAAFAIDWGDTPTGIQEPPGHRNNIMRSDYREVGIAIVAENNPDTEVGPLVITQNFGLPSDLENSWLLGVVFNDFDGDNFYDSGEGLANTNISINGVNSSFSTTTMTAGGYQIQVPTGNYAVTFSGNGLIEPITQTVNVGLENVKLDLNTSDFIV